MKVPHRIQKYRLGRIEVSFRLDRIVHQLRHLNGSLEDGISANPNFFRSQPIVVAFIVNVKVTIPAVRKSTCRRIGSGIEKVYDTISAIVSPNAPRNPPQLKIVDSRTDKPYPDRFMIG